MENNAVIVEPNQKAVFNVSRRLTTTANDDPAFAQWREQNNPTFEREKNAPGDFLLNQYKWRKNTINQTVVEGTLTNNASLAAYSHIVLELKYNKSNGDITTIDFIVAETVLPGETISYRKRLLDILTSKQSVTAQIKTANATSKNVY
jgi:hypothetical protein